MLSGVLAWLADNPRAFETAASRHLALSATALTAAIAIALPLALVLVRWDRVANAAIAAVNVLRTIPSLALLVAALPLLGTGFLPAVIALTLYGLPAILINTHTALREVDPDVVEAGLGQGMTGRQIMRRIKIPLALPVIFAGIRTAAVQIVSAATLAAFIGGGGLGELITAGMGTLNIPELVLGGLAVAALAVATELAFALVEWGVRRQIGSVAA
jgi:osmoprotectant transport system permease protein